MLLLLVSVFVLAVALAVTLYFVFRGGSLSRQEFLASSALFNTTMISVAAQVSASQSGDNVADADLTYSSTVSALPTTLDLGTLWKSTQALDQAGCGSCWAFSSASMFTDRIRHGLWLRANGNYDPLMKTPFFANVTITTGESDIEVAPTTGQPVNVSSKLYKQTVMDRISPYFVAGFAPKMLDACQNIGSSDCIDTSCVGGKNPDDPNLRAKCSGCQGNTLLMPLLLFTGGGAARISQYGLEDWACAFGGTQYCSSDNKPNYTLYKASKYLYRDQSSRLDAPNIVAAGIKNLSDWMRLELMERGPLTVSFMVYPSFFAFFTNPKTMQGVYSEKNKLPNEAVQGGHAVSINGYGTEDGVDYWLIRNSWGKSWAFAGYFKIQRGVNFCEIEANMTGVMLSDADYASFLK
jgi:Papain family cysteine protease